MVGVGLGFLVLGGAVALFAGSLLVAALYIGFLAVLLASVWVTLRQSRPSLLSRKLL
jgi:hypothetical protein